MIWDWTINPTYHLYIIYIYIYLLEMKMHNFGKETHFN